MYKRWEELGMRMRRLTEEEIEYIEKHQKVTVNRRSPHISLVNERTPQALQGLFKIVMCVFVF